MNKALEWLAFQATPQQRADFTAYLNAATGDLSEAVEDIRFTRYGNNVSSVPPFGIPFRRALYICVGTNISMEFNGRVTSSPTYHAFSSCI